MTIIEDQDVKGGSAEAVYSACWANN